MRTITTLPPNLLIPPPLSPFVSVSPQNLFTRRILIAPPSPSLIPSNLLHDLGLSKSQNWTDVVYKYRQFHQF